MSDSTKIEFADATWNPVTGCTPISPGCDNCWAKGIARRFHGKNGYPEKPDEFSVTVHPGRLLQPEKWRKPRRIFVCSMGDLFHEDVPDSFIWSVLSVISNVRRHTFLILTKRPERMMKLMSSLQNIEWPIPNLWLGVSVENQAMADERIPSLLRTPAAIRFINCEPLLGNLNIDHYLQMGGICECGDRRETMEGCKGEMIRCNDGTRTLDWVVAGGESGQRARPMHPSWIRTLRYQCIGNDKPFFFKQWGQWQNGSSFGKKKNVNRIVLNDGRIGHMPADLGFRSCDYKKWQQLEPTNMAKIGKKTAGRILDGLIWEECPNA